MFESRQKRKRAWSDRGIDYDEVLGCTEVGGRQKTISGPKGMGETHTGSEQADKTGNGIGSEKTAQRRKKRSRNDGEGSIVEIETKKKLIRGSWSVCGLATKGRRMIQIAEQVGERDLDIVGNQESWKKQGREIGYKDGQYAWMGKRKKRHNSNNSGAGRVGFLFIGKEHFCGIIVVIKDTRFDERIWINIQGGQGAQYY